ncbi:NAD(P)-binding protein [Exidia glandulosa HHB12029]|uniref:NAD(P)-binding protein n=1 Tax=Exidia glandulosa HHB12029 TaxID=1314781 RepID=A0A165NQV8_EXIGL|nr:NAD(P)-binding protein [Exidia glandulosa HHB12029]
MGNLLSQTFPPKPRWTAKDIPDLTGKVAVVTGANVGIGKETAKELLAHGAKVYIAARSKDKVDAAIADLKVATGKEALFLELDLADLPSVKRAAETILSQESQVDILIASAGVMVPPIDLLTKQGYDLQFGTNVLGHWYFIKLLLPALHPGARVVTVASSAADLASPVNWDALTDTPARKKFGTQKLYGQSKLFNIIVTKEFAKRYADKGVIFSSLNPGNIQTALQRHVPAFQRLLLKLLIYKVEFGALTSLYAATAPEANLNGAYYIPWARPGKATSKALDPAAGPRIWDWLEDQVKTV